MSDRQKDTRPKTKDIRYVRSDASRLVLDMGFTRKQFPCSDVYLTIVKVPEASGRKVQFKQY